MHKISLLSQKGGSGKSTIAVHLAVAAEQHGLKVALVDIDPQASAAAWHEGREAQTPLLAQCSAAELKETLDECRDAGMDLTVIDTAPHSNTESLEAARLSDFMVIPCRPTILDLRAVAPSIDIAAAVNIPMAVVLSSCPPASSAGEPVIVRESRQALEDDYQVRVWPGRITQRVAYHYALIDGRAVTEYETDGKAAKEIKDLWQWVFKELEK